MSTHTLAMPLPTINFITPSTSYAWQYYNHGAWQSFLLSLSSYFTLWNFLLQLPLWAVESISVWIYPPSSQHSLFNSVLSLLFLNTIYCSVSPFKVLAFALYDDPLIKFMYLFLSLQQDAMFLLLWTHPHSLPIVSLPTIRYLCHTVLSICSITITIFSFFQWSYSVLPL